jgi:hypothetical protein
LGIRVCDARVGESQPARVTASILKEEVQSDRSPLEESTRRWMIAVREISESPFTAINQDDRGNRFAALVSSVRLHRHGGPQSGARDIDGQESR